MAWAWDVVAVERMPATAAMVLLRMAWRWTEWDEDRGREWTVAMLAADCGAGQRPVRDGLRELERRGRVLPKPRPGRPTVYWLAITPAESAAPDPTPAENAAHPGGIRRPREREPRRNPPPQKENLAKTTYPAARGSGSTWVATLPELAPEPEPDAFTSGPEPYTKCPECGGVGFVVVGGRRSVCRNGAAHRG